MKKLTIALLSGGKSSEREVSLKSGDQVFEALDREKYNVLRYDPQTDLDRLVADADRIDVHLLYFMEPSGRMAPFRGCSTFSVFPIRDPGYWEAQLP